MEGKPEGRRTPAPAAPPSERSFLGRKPGGLPRGRLRGRRSPQAVHGQFGMIGGCSDGCGISGIGAGEMYGGGGSSDAQYLPPGQNG
jgi:hypothetical protein